VELCNSVNIMHVVGRLCEFPQSARAGEILDSCDSFENYLGEVTSGVQCGDGSSGTLVWTPDANTPNTVFYQVCLVRVEERANRLS
jgi:hypothetical protein